MRVFYYIEIPNNESALTCSIECQKRFLNPIVNNECTWIHVRNLLPYLSSVDHSRQDLKKTFIQISLIHIIFEFDSHRQTLH